MRKKRTNLPFTLGLVGTFLIHGSLIYYVVHEEIQLLDELIFNHYVSNSTSIYSPPTPASSLHIPDPSLDSTIETPQLVLLPPPPPEIDRFDIPDFGDKDGTGEGSVASEGDEPLQAREADENQPFLSRDPVGPLVNANPSPSTALPGIPNPGLPIPIRPAQPPVAPTPQITPQIGSAPQGPFGVEAPPLPPTPLLAARPPIADIDKPQTDTIIGEQSLQRVPDEENPEKIIETPPDKSEEPPNRLLAMLDNILQPTTRQALTLLPDSDPTSPSTQPVKGPTTRSAIALDNPKENPSTVGTSPDAAPTTQPLGKNPTVALDSPTTRPTTRPSDNPAAPNPQIAMMIPTAPMEGASPTPVAPQGNIGDAGLPIAPADPAPMSDLESDPFAKQGSVIVRPGKLDVQIGRKVKPIRPQFNLRGQMDNLYGATVSSRVSFDATGKVTDVKILQSSGSTDIDLAVEVALYKWWFEPTTNKQGVPRGDFIILALRFL